MNPTRRLAPSLASLTLVAALASCSPRFRPVPDGPSFMLGASARGPTGGVYEGPAVVERSIPDQVVMAFESDPTNGERLPRHVTFSGLGPAVFPVGGKVWLRKNPAVPAAQGVGPGVPTPTWSFAVFAQKDGRLLFGAASAPTVEELASASVIPLEETSKTADTFGGPCGSGTIARSIFDVHGDAPVAVADGETSTVVIGGADYDVGILGRATMVTDSNCADYGGSSSSFAISVRARDLSALASTLELAPLPTCALGNAVGEGAGFFFYNVSIDTTYDGPVFYKRPGDPLLGNCYDLTVPGLATSAGLPPPVLEACLPADRLAEPAVGQEFWATVPSISRGALRQPNNGALIAAAVFPSDLDAPANFSELIGTDAILRSGCDYAYYNKPNGSLAIYQLQEAAFGANGDVVVGSGDHGVISLGGASYDVWLSVDGAVSILAK